MLENIKGAFANVYNFLQGAGASIESGAPFWAAINAEKDFVQGMRDFANGTYQDIQIIIAGIAPVDDGLLTELKNKAVVLQKDPTNYKLRQEILDKQVTMTQKQLGLTRQQAADSVRSVMANYAQSKGMDEFAMLNALTDDEQKILDYSRNSPTIFGVDLTTANRMAAVSMRLSGRMLLISTVMIYFMIFSKGGKAALETLGGKGISKILAKVSISIPATVTVTSFVWSEFFGHVATDIPMITKQLIDNGSIGPGLRITAIELAEKTKATIQGAGTTGTLTAAQYNNFASGLEAAGISKIYNPTYSGPVAYSRVELSNLVKYVYGQLLLNGQKTSATALIAAVVPYLKDSGNNTVSATIESAGVASVTTIPKVKVFTGTVASGTLGAAVEFTGRENDLITTVAELQDSAQNNLALFATSLPGRLTYEVRIVSSVVDKNGFKITGGSQTVIGSYDSKGLPRYKTVVNRFAVLDVYVINDKMSRIKIKEITLGPTDAVKLQPTSTALATVSSQIGANLFTNNIADITGIQTAQPVTVSTPPVSVGTVINVTPPVPVATPTQGSQPSAPATTPAPTSSPAPTVAPTPAPVSSAPVVVATPAWKTATNLSEFYSAIGQNLPSLSERATLYASYGLGSASLYAGTAEQNTKLLQYLQSHR